MMLFLKRLFGHLNSNQDTLFGKLRPQIVGSIPEGTRVGEVNEIDAMCHLQTLEEDNFPLFAEDAQTLKVKKQNHPLQRYCSKDDNAFRFDDFLGDMMKTVELAMSCIDMPDHLSITPRQFKCKPIIESGKPMTHCTECISPVTFTKSGVCIILKWNENEFVTIDLVPVFPVQFQNCKKIPDIFSMLIKDLSEKKPLKWKKHLQKVVKADRILPEFYDDLNKNSSHDLIDGICIVSLKMLHFNSQDNFVIRPAQLLNVVDFSGYPSAVKEVYFRMKYLKQTLNIKKIESYLMKKVVLRQEFLIEIEKGGSVEDHLYEAMNYHPVKKVFQEKIDYQKWEKQTDKKTIPIFNAEKPNDKDQEKSTNHHLEKASHGHRDKPNGRVQILGKFAPWEKQTDKKIIPIFNSEMSDEAIHVHGDKPKRRSFAGFENQTLLSATNC